MKILHSICPAHSVLQRRSENHQGGATPPIFLNEKFSFKKELPRVLEFGVTWFALYIAKISGKT